MTISEYLLARKGLIEQALEREMISLGGPFSAHISAMRYSLFAGGKRLRPILCLAAAEAVTDDNGIMTNLLPIACALECIHTYSLIHDDLPAMDDDDLRRGKPTNHKVYGEAAAILAGDGLLTYAFELLSRPSTIISAENCLKISHLIAGAAGSLGMVGGQSLDIENEHREYRFELLKTIHKSKTGALITCSVQVGAIGGGADYKQEQSLKSYGKFIGLAFQIVDDLLDATSTTEELGKTAGSDSVRGKATYPAFFGIDKTKHKAREAIQAAKSALSSFDHRADPLRHLADYIYLRTH
jgi:geranylgeranyl diphosphate synthase type II